MKKNISNLEIVIRLLAGIAIGDLALDRACYGEFNMLYWVLTAVLALTALTGFCPLYALIHLIRHGGHHHQHQ